LNTEANDAVVKLYDVLGNLVAEEKRLVDQQCDYIQNKLE
jgi:hypothetical protein